MPVKSVDLRRYVPGGASNFARFLALRYTTPAILTVFIVSLVFFCVTFSASRSGAFEALAFHL